MNNTAKSFHDKWTKNETLAFEDTSRPGSDTYNWILTRNGFADGAALKNFLEPKKRILDAGCGNGRVTNLLHQHAGQHAQLVGIDLVAADVAKNNLSHLPRISTYSKDLLAPLDDLGVFDFIYCQEVLHHTKDPRAGFLNLCTLLEKNGEIAIYVYKKKAPVREYVDDFIREKMAPLPYEDAIAMSRQITDLGKCLTDLNIEFDCPAVDALEIPAGRYTVQRFLYHFFMKCYWNPELGYEPSAAINYDWYHPQYATRHTMQEVLGWFKDAGLSVTHQYEDFYGITVRGKKA